MTAEQTRGDYRALRTTTAERPRNDYRARLTTTAEQTRNDYQAQAVHGAQAEHDGLGEDVLVGKGLF